MNIFTGIEYHGLKLLKQCGSGAYGDVYYCRDISGCELAVKIVSKQKLGEQWERELRGVTNYRKITENSSELLQIYHVEEDEETFFYTMEAADSASSDSYLPDTLNFRLKDGPLPQTDIFRILSGIFSGIKMIHDAVPYYLLFGETDPGSVGAQPGKGYPNGRPKKPDSTPAFFFSGFFGIPKMP